MAYDAPTPADLKARYATFADVDDAIVQYWLTDAQRFVDTSWLESDYAPALMALAAHNLSIAGHGTEAEATADLPSGITSMKIGTLGLAFDSQTTRDKVQGSYESTRYGAEYKRLLRRNRSGPRVAATGVAPLDPYRYPMGET